MASYSDALAPGNTPIGELVAKILPLKVLFRWHKLRFLTIKAGGRGLAS